MSKKTSSGIFYEINRAFFRIASFFALIVDKLLYSNRYASLVSLAIAALLFISVNYSNQQANSITSSYTFDNVTIETLVNKEMMDVVGIPDNVTAVVTGDFVTVNAMKNDGQVSVVLDLEALSEGNHRVKFGIKGFLPGLSVVLSPEYADVSLQRKSSRTFLVTPEFINLDRLDAQYIVSEPILDLSEVTINASNEKLDSISMVRALIDVKDKKESFTIEAQVKIYDQDGKLMDVVVSPSVVNASVAISSPNRQVPIVIKPTGTIPNNKAIDSITMDFESVTLYAPQEVLNKISSIEVPINAESLTMDTKLKVTLPIPEGVRSMNTTSVSLDIKLGDKQLRSIEGSQIFFENNNKNYEIKKSNNAPMVADVIIEGTQARIDAIDVSKIRVSLDMKNINIGPQKVKLIVEGPDSLLTYRLVSDEIDIVVTQKEN